MNTNIQIRKAIEADLEVITEIINHEILNAAVLYEYEPRAVKQQTEWFTEKQQHRWPIIVAELYQLYFKMCYKEFELFFAPFAEGAVALPVS
tara:strand:+ start:54 stop:329 length:276 start_codon:yes stop_codon:yes gene_type:complete